MTTEIARLRDLLDGYSAAEAWEYAASQAGGGPTRWATDEVAFEAALDAYHAPYNSAWERLGGLMRGAA